MEDSALQKVWIRMYLQSQLDLSIFREQEALFVLALPLLIDLIRNENSMGGVFNETVCTVYVTIWYIYRYTNIILMVLSMLILCLYRQRWFVTLIYWLTNSQHGSISTTIK